MLGIKVNTIFGIGIVNQLPEDYNRKRYGIKMINPNDLGKTLMENRRDRMLLVLKNEILGELEND